VNYKEEVMEAAKIQNEFQRREKMNRIVEMHEKPFKIVFRDVVNASHKLRGYKR